MFLKRRWRAPAVEILFRTLICHIFHQTYPEALADTAQQGNTVLATSTPLAVGLLQHVSGYLGVTEGIFCE